MGSIVGLSTPPRVPVLVENYGFNGAPTFSELFPVPDRTNDSAERVEKAAAVALKLYKDILSESGRKFDVIEVEIDAGFEFTNEQTVKEKLTRTETTNLKSEENTKTEKTKQKNLDHSISTKKTDKQERVYSKNDETQIKTKVEKTYKKSICPVNQLMEVMDLDIVLQTTAFILSIIMKLG